MSCNIVEEYVSFSKKTIKKYLHNILGHYFDQDIYDDLIHAYIYTRYYNLYPVVDKRFEVNIVHYLKKALVGVKDDKRYQKKAKYMFSMFKYILYFDHVCECDSVRNLISEIASFRKTELEMEDDQFEVTFYHQLKDDLTAKQEFIDKFQDKNFTVNYTKINQEQIFDCQLEHHLKFSKLYSDYAISKVFNNKDMQEQKLFVLYSLVGVKILQDIIKGIFHKTYLLDYVLDLKDKPKKKKRLLTMIDNDITKEKMAFKIEWKDYLKNKEEVYELTRSGYHIAIVLDDSFVLDEDSKARLKVFTYVITHYDAMYDKLKDEFDILYIPSQRVIRWIQYFDFYMNF